MKAHTVARPGVVFFWALALSLPAIADTAAIENAANAEEKGRAIAVAHKTTGSGWGDAQSELQMIIRSANGKERNRKISVKSLEVIEDGDRSLMIFNEPRDVAGTAFLSYSHINQADDQWIYLPALKRVKRIASNNKSGAFMGSEFAYEDMSSFEVEKFEFKFLREEVLNSLDCYVIESHPLDPHSGYSRLVSWLDKDELRFQKIEFYDRKKSLLKVLQLQDYELFQDTYWRALRSVMENRQNGKVTVLLSENLRLSTGLNESDFSMNSLKRAR